MNFIGKTARIKSALCASRPDPDGEPLERCFLFSGPPGVGKSSLAAWWANTLAGAQHNLEQLNGQSCSVEIVRAWQAQQIYHRPLFGDYTVQLVEEIDACSNAAANQLRSYLDSLPSATLFIATTNKQPDQLQEQLQSRFQVFLFEPVPEPEIIQWLKAEYEVAEATARLIAAKVNGNVRAAKADALAYLRARRAVA